MKVNRTTLMLRMAKETGKANPSSEILDILYKVSQRLYKQEKQKHCLLQEVEISKKDFSLLFP